MKTTKICTLCGNEKRIEDFPMKYDRDHHPGRRKSYCKICKNREKQVRSGANRMAWKMEYGGKCTVCGYNKCMAALEFHHREPGNKDNGPSDIIGKYNPKTANLENINFVYTELDKCDLLCANCHREIHSLDINE